MQDKGLYLLSMQWTVPKPMAAYSESTCQLMIPYFTLAITASCKGIAAHPGQLYRLEISDQSKSFTTGRHTLAREHKLA